MDDDEFVEQFKARDIARGDQAEAARAAQRDAKAHEVFLRERAKAEVREFEPIARSIVEKIGGDRLVMMNAANGFAIKSGADYATIYEAPPMYANVAVTSIMVNFSRMQSNFVTFGYGEPEYNPPREQRYEPRWDAKAGAIRWHRGGSGVGYLTRELVQHVIAALQKRAA